jgi:mono/diheme cytochrome c family protein
MIFALAGLFVLVAAAFAGWSYMTRPQFSPAERGRRLAERYGCTGCHGPDGAGGVFNPGRTDGVVPNWRDELMMFASDTAQIRQWIANGVTDSKAQSQSWRDERSKGALKMPAFGKRLSAAQIDDLVSFVRLINGQLRPDDSLPRVGYFRADSLGCFGCHGDGGWLSRPNPRSFKGYVASWATADFRDLARDRQEFDQWVSTGVADRLMKNPVAAYLLRRPVLHMIAYRDHLRPGDLDALWAYVQWLQSSPTPAP